MKQFKPVLVREKDGDRLLRREVRDVETAGQIHRSWPGRGKAWRRAADALSDVQYDEATVEEVREAFVAAAREAGVLIERED